MIEGHPDPSVSVRFSPQFHSLLEWSSGGKPAAGATDIPGAMAEALGDGMATTEEAFQRLVAEEGALDPAALGTPVDWRRVLDEPGAGPAPPAARNLNVYASHLSSAHEQLRVSGRGGFFWNRCWRPDSQQFMKGVCRLLDTVACTSLAGGCAPGHVPCRGSLR